MSGPHRTRVQNTDEQWRRRAQSGHYGRVDPAGAVVEHLKTFFAGHEVTVVDWKVGPIESRVAGFEVARIGPGPRASGLWTYVTLGCWESTQTDGHGLEFIITARLKSDRLAELLAMCAYYHAGPPSQRLDLGHTVPIGEPWLPGSGCDHYLVSLPYPFGSDLEICDWGDGHARLLWLLPITEAERDYKADHGQEALEQRFEDAKVKYWDATRASVV